jgi:sialidase-1
MQFVLRRRAAVCLILSAAAAAAKGPVFDTSRVFEGGTGGYKLYRIPGIVVTKKGTILIYTEGRRTGSGDWDSIDILLRRSTDGGKTFSPQRVIARAPGKIDRSPWLWNADRANRTT